MLPLDATSNASLMENPFFVTPLTPCKLVSNQGAEIEGDALTVLFPNAAMGKAH
jgi:hypothetical protein